MLTVQTKAINDRIKEQDFQDCKVRVTNVDSQGSDQNIVIQVIGEISNKAAPHRKFVQTFVLAEQTNGYFVLNDIFRYIQEEELEAAEETQTKQADLISGYDKPAPAAAEPETKPSETTADETVQSQEAAAKVDEELDVAAQPEANAAKSTEVNGASVTESSEVTRADEPPAVPVAIPEKINKPEATPTPPTEETLQPENPKEPEPTRAATPKASPAPPAVPAPPKTSVPKTWASLAASAVNKVATPNVTVPSPTPTTSAQPKSATQSQQQAPSTPVAPATPNPAREPSPANSQGDAGSGWQTAGADHNKRQSRTQTQVAPENQSTRAYIKNVYESVDGDALKSTLAKYGELAYFDISRQKVIRCASVLEESR